MKDHISPIIFELSKRFDFDYKKALIYAGVIEIKCLLPFVGKIRCGCRGIQWSYGLHTQCQKPVIDDGKYCFKCELKREKNKFLGDIDERFKYKLVEYIDKKGRKTVPWINYINDKKFDKELCFRYARNMGIEIPKEHLEERIMRRGRPKKKPVKKALINNTFNILGSDFSEEILELYQIDNNLAKDDKENLYDLYDFGAVKRECV